MYGAPELWPGTRTGDVEGGTSELSQIGLGSVAADIRRITEGNGHVANNLWSRAATGATVSLADIEAIYSQYPSIADDLVDVGRVEMDSSTKTDDDYLQARVDIRETSSSELHRWLPSGWCTCFC